MKKNGQNEVMDFNLDWNRLKCLSCKVSNTNGAARHPTISNVRTVSCLGCRDLQELGLLDELRNGPRWNRTSTMLSINMWGMSFHGKIGMMLSRPREEKSSLSPPIMCIANKEEVWNLSMMQPSWYLGLQASAIIDLDCTGWYLLRWPRFASTRVPNQYQDQHLTGLI